jgi:GNAT superfamily N-acetyltransferase
MSNIEIRELPKTKKAIKEFVVFSKYVYTDYPHWVAPIYSDQIKFISKGPFNEIGEFQLFMAYCDGKPVARISAHRSFAHNDHYKTNQGFWGFFEGYNDWEAVSTIFGAAAKWLKDKGCESMIGPLNFAIYDEIGILMDNYDVDPVIMCTYNPPYYPELLSKLGFVKEVDWYAYMKDGREPLTPIMVRLTERMKRQEGVVLREINIKKFYEEAAHVKHIFNKAWSENWGNVPFTEKQWQHIVSELKMIIKKELAFIVEVNGKPVGFSISIPDANQALKKAKGKLFPFGIFKILWGMRKGQITTLRTVILGVLDEYRRRGYDMAMIQKIIENGRALGYNDSDCSLIVETNARMMGGLEAIDAKRYKTYRIFKKEI